MLHHFFSNYGIVFYYPNDLFYMENKFNNSATALL